MTQTEALKLALEALEKLTNAAEGFSVSGVYFNEELWARKCLDDAYDAMGFAQEALAQPEQEPVAYTNGTDVILAKHWTADYPPEGWKPLGYTTPPQRKPLTEDEAVSAVSSVLPVTSTGGQTHYLQIQHKHALEITRAIEAAHGIKENT